jgi:hypothetical protein
MDRAVKLFLERRSIEAFRQNTRHLRNESERLTMTDPHMALMVLRHYNVPTRILDWSRSPYIAAFFVANTAETHDAEVWAFDEPLYGAEGLKQWDVGPPVTRNGEFDTQYSMFMPDLGGIDWFIRAFYFPDTFPRQHAQHGAFSPTAQFEVDHARHIPRLLQCPDRGLRYVIPASLKAAFRTHLRVTEGVETKTLLPDSGDHAQANAVAAAAGIFGAR